MSFHGLSASGEWGCQHLPAHQLSAGLCLPPQSWHKITRDAQMPQGPPSTREAPPQPCSRKALKVPACPVCSAAIPPPWESPLPERCATPCWHSLSRFYPWLSTKRWPWLLPPSLSAICLLSFPESDAELMTPCEKGVKFGEKKQAWNGEG